MSRCCFWRKVKCKLRRWRVIWESLRSYPRYIHMLLKCIMEKLNELEVNIMVTQEMLDALVARIDTAVANIRQDIQDVKDANPELDLSRLEASVAGLEGLDAENPAPVVEEPVEPTE